MHSLRNILPHHPHPHAHAHLLFQGMTEINYQLELQLKWSVGSWELRADCHSTGEQHTHTHTHMHRAVQQAAKLSLIMCRFWGTYL